MTLAAAIAGLHPEEGNTSPHFADACQWAADQIESRRSELREQAAKEAERFAHPDAAFPYLVSKEGRRLRNAYLAERGHSLRA